MKEKTKQELIKVYDEYFRCSNPRCHSVYHISNFHKGEFICKDCDTTSIVPAEVKQRKK